MDKSTFRKLIYAASGAFLALAPVSHAPLFDNAASAQSANDSAESMLRAAVRRLASNPKDLYALLDAGNASLELGDANAAMGFFRRAEQVEPNNSGLKLGMARASLRMEDPVGAIRLFDEAQQLGIAPSLMALDRALAYDLVGNFDKSEAQYAIAAGNITTDELYLRYGISLSISGRPTQATPYMQPLLDKNDPGAWRAQAFLYAAQGDMKQAEQVASSFLDPSGVQRLRPYFQRMPSLTPAQQMAAIHYGHFPTSNLGQDSPQIAAMQPVKSDSAQPTARSGGGKSSASKAKFSPPVLKDFRGKKQRGVAYAPPQKSLPTAVQAPPAVMASAQTAPVRPAFETVDVVKPVESSQSPWLVMEAAGQSASAGTYVDSKGVRRRVGEDAPVNIIAPAPVVANVAEPSLPVAQASAPIIWAETSVETQTQPQAKATPTLPAVAEAEAPVVQPILAQVTTVAEIPMQQTLPATSQANLPAASASPAAPGFTSGPDLRTNVPESSAIVLPSQPQKAPENAVVKQRDLASLVGDIEVPEAEKQLSVVPVTQDVIAETAPSAPVIKPAPVVQPKPQTPVSKPSAPAAKQPAAPQYPARNWVQIATGGDTAALKYDYRKWKRKLPDLFTAVSGWTAPWSNSHRLVIGPFESLSDARKWDKEYRDGGGDSYVWQSEDGTIVEPLP